ncbi:hypothetical protein [Amycolatopsis thermophila]|uniref:Uncharacterized protein n=1 Tax=Amycolatopsis thermophila TaxID=206084 RepID=A0ABU0ETG9_9PSEU|nr:hypothetical protein [Amycolatopsis thermophila]MDQ0378604.1 hypothetical protein [Amycolatopsis thermophila]
MGKKSNMVPLPTSGGGTILPKLIGVLVTVAALAVVIKHPSDAATWAKTLASAAGRVIDGVATFIRQVAS